MLDQPIPEAADQAWEAYNAMDATKQRHLLLLQGLEQKYRKYGSASATEQALLARLLRDHDRQVERFRAAMASLRKTSPDAHQALLAYIALLNTSLAAFAPAPPAADAQN